MCKYLVGNEKKSVFNVDLGSLCNSTKGSGLTGKTYCPREYGERSRRLINTVEKIGKMLITHTFVWGQRLTGFISFLPDKAHGK